MAAIKKLILALLLVTILITIGCGIGAGVAYAVNGTTSGWFWALFGIFMAGLLLLLILTFIDHVLHVEDQKNKFKDFKERTCLRIKNAKRGFNGTAPIPVPDDCNIATINIKNSPEIQRVEKMLISKIEAEVAVAHATEQDAKAEKALQKYEKFKSEVIFDDQKINNVQLRREALQRERLLNRRRCEPSPVRQQHFTQCLQVSDDSLDICGTFAPDSFRDKIKGLPSEDLAKLANVCAYR